MVQGFGNLGFRDLVTVLAYGVLGLGVKGSRI